MKNSLLTFLAIDIGASSGRIVSIKFDLENQSSTLDVIHRFNHHIITKENYMCWDLDYIKEEIIKGLSSCSHLNPISLAIDTWGVDYVLKGEDNSIIMPPISYRDVRTSTTIQEFHQESGISLEECFNKTGIQPYSFNTLYQLYSLKKTHPDIIKKIHKIALLPDELVSFLTKYDGCEYTNATTTQMINHKTKTWDLDLLRVLGIEPNQWGELHNPGMVVGPISKSTVQKTKLPTETVVVSTNSHDTASAVVGAFLDDESAFLNLGTWALLGCLNKKGFFTHEDLKEGWSNETLSTECYRPLRNIMGQWIITKFKEDIGDNRSFDEITTSLADLPSYQYFIDVNNFIFFNPPNMKDAIDRFLTATKQSTPTCINAYYRLIYENLALCYDHYISKLSQKMTIKKLHIIGGGTQDKFSIPLIAELTGLPIYIGSSEATAIGNIYQQARALGFHDEIKKCLEEFIPKFTIHNSDNSCDDIKKIYNNYLEKYKGIKL